MPPSRRPRDRACPPAVVPPRTAFETSEDPVPPDRETVAMTSPITGTWNDDPAHFRRPSRRGFLQVGLVGGLGLTLDQFFRLQAQAGTEAPKGAPAQSVIHIFLPGGMAHQESFDPKPLAPIEYRGEMSSVKTKI